MQQRYIDTKAAAEYVGYSWRSLEQFRCLGKGPKFYKFGYTVRYTIEDLDAWAGEAQTSTQEVTEGRKA